MARRSPSEAKSRPASFVRGAAARTRATRVASPLHASLKPCPCGYFGDPGRACTCEPLGVERYVARSSGPLVDRIDIHVEVPAVPYNDLSCERSGEASAAIRARVNAARRRQLERFAGRAGIYANAHLAGEGRILPQHVSEAVQYRSLDRPRSSPEFCVKAEDAPRPLPHAA